MPYQFILDGMTWSFSSVNCYCNCPKCFFLTYIQKAKKTNNAFAQWGSFGHSLLESYYKHEMEFFELSDQYKKNYGENVTIKFPPNRYTNLDKSYYDAGVQYFNNFEGDFQNAKILGVEQKVNLTIGGHPFVGYIDLVVQDDNGIIICDHKSKSKFTSEKEKHEFLRQLYLYSLWIKEQYGVYPYKLVFNMFRAGSWEEAEFDEKELESTIQWFTSTIDQIYADTKFTDKIAAEYKAKGKKLSDFKRGDFFCNYLCSVKQHCLRSQEYHK